MSVCRPLAFVVLLLLSWPAHALAPVEVRTEAGTVAWLVEDHTVPALSFSLTLRHAGSAYDPPGKEGRASLVSSMLMEGAGERNSQDFHETLDFYAIRLGTDVSRDDLGIAFTTLKEHTQVAFSLLHDMLDDPHFAPADLERLRAEQLMALQQKQGDASYRASLAFFQTAFAGHPYGRATDGTAESVASLTRGDMLTYKATHLKRGEMQISVTGDINPTELKALLEQYIDPLPAGNTLSAELPEVTPVLASHKSEALSVPQTVVYFALPGVARTSKDYYTAFVMNHLLGGSGLSSRLAKEIREKRGLAYYAYSDLLDLEKSALLMGSFATRNEEAPAAIEALKQVLTKTAKEGFAQKEFAEGVSYLTGAFPAKLTSNRSVNAYLDSMQRYHLGMDYLNKRNDYLKAVTLEEVNAMAKNLFKPENLLIITAGGAVAEAAPDKTIQKTTHE